MTTTDNSNAINSTELDNTIKVPESITKENTPKPSKEWIKTNKNDIKFHTKLVCEK